MIITEAQVKDWLERDDPMWNDIYFDPVGRGWWAFYGTQALPTPAPMGAIEKYYEAIQLKEQEEAEERERQLKIERDNKFGYFKTCARYALAHWRIQLAIANIPAPPDPKNTLIYSRITATIGISFSEFELDDEGRSLCKMIDSLLAQALADHPNLRDNNSEVFESSNEINADEDGVKITLVFRVVKKEGYRPNVGECIVVDDVHISPYGFYYKLCSDYKDANHATRNSLKIDKFKRDVLRDGKSVYRRIW